MEMAARGSTGPLRGRTLVILASLLGVAIIVLSVIAGRLGFQSYAAHQEQVRRQAATQAARQQAVNLMTINHKHPQRAIDRMLQGATGSYKKQLAAKSKKLKQRVKKFNAVSRGEVLAAGVKSIDQDSAEVLVVLDSYVRNKGTAKKSAQSKGKQQAAKGSSGSGKYSAPRHYRLKFTLDNKNGSWLVSKIDIIP